MQRVNKTSRMVIWRVTLWNKRSVQDDGMWIWVEVSQGIVYCTG